MRINWLPLIVGLIAALFLLVGGLQMGPFGRRQIVALNPQQEAQLGAQAYRQVLSQSDVLPRGPLVEKVREIGLRLADASQDIEVLKLLQLRKQKFAWEFQVVRSRQVNAFCLPGGKVVVYTGIIPVCQNEDGLATVMGHEIGHALAHHGAERMAQRQLVQIGQVALSSSIEGLSYEQQRWVMGAIGAGSQFGILLPYSRAHESEADHIGILLMAKAGYDPREAILFWQRMDKMGGRRDRPEFASTHPNPETRVRDLEHWLKEALPLYQRSTPRDGKRRLPMAAHPEPVLPALPVEVIGRAAASVPAEERLGGYRLAAVCLEKR
jgi:predicted Zn-dependent protease